MPKHLSKANPSRRKKDSNKSQKAANNPNNPSRRLKQITKSSGIKRMDSNKSQKAASGIKRVVVCRFAIHLCLGVPNQVLRHQNHQDMLVLAASGEVLVSLQAVNAVNTANAGLRSASDIESKVDPAYLLVVGKKSHTKQGQDDFGLAAAHFRKVEAPAANAFCVGL